MIKPAENGLQLIIKEVRNEMSVTIPDTDKLYYFYTNVESILDALFKCGYDNIILRPKSGLSDNDISNILAKRKNLFLVWYNDDNTYYKEEYEKLRAAGFTPYGITQQAYILKGNVINSISDFTASILSDIALIEEKVIDWNLTDDFDNLCGNCHLELEKNAKYCQYCGTERGAGHFIPYENSEYTLYGPPILGQYKCEKCGYTWSFCNIGLSYKYCKNCGTEGKCIQQTLFDVASLKKLSMNKMTIMEAFEILSQNEPDLHPWIGYEYDNFFEFGLANLADPIVNSCSYVIDKENKTGHWYRPDLEAFFNGEPPAIDFGDFIKEYNEREISKLWRKYKEEKP